MNDYVKGETLTVEGQSGVYLGERLDEGVVVHVFTNDDGEFTIPKPLPEEA